MRNKPLMLMILDGWGLKEGNSGNAIALAKTPNFDRYQREYPYTTLSASGEDVGLPEGQMGNSEVGHLNMGAGRVVYQELTRITKAIRDGDFFTNPVLVEAVEKAKSGGTALHLMGLLSDGGVHSHINHLFALLDLVDRTGLRKVFIHVLLDGRDVAPTSAMEYITALEKKLAELGFGEIATVAGRYYTMDRDRRWERVEKGYNAMVLGTGPKAAMSRQVVESAYEHRITDEFVEPTVIVDEKGNPKGLIQDGDVVIFYNFRADRAREISRAFVDEEFDGFERPADYPRVHYVCMTQYDKTIPAPVAFPMQNLENTLGEYLANKGLRQLRIAETEKYAHVTFFFNGGIEEAYPNEDRVLIPSPKVATYNLKPEMSAYEITDRVIEEIKQDRYDVIILNFANPDMVGHTGVLDAAVKSVEVVDECLGRIVETVREFKGCVLVTADHGNAETMIDESTGEPQTAHTDNKVPFILVDDELKDVDLAEGSLQDIAPTMLELLKLEKPAEMTGKSLIIK